ncbi:hypothetical protein TL16_g03566 [Triparma laevis f. inornata]|uniref:Uncharacterized protein n=1 Tax=Triparma laevis f. inornata TaxID=1714386 RepID=A0A9W7A549_9STRA|nr:hypothetical protein TL16_g03566 [Triparma laevis f. inornata]
MPSKSTHTHPTEDSSSLLTTPSSSSNMPSSSSSSSSSPTPLHPFLAQVISLLYWAMLAASTIGPGTITLMAKGGADYQLTLTWTVPLASITAYVVYEAVARMQIEAGKSLGGALFQHYFPKNAATEASSNQQTSKSTLNKIVAAVPHTPVISYALSFLVLISMTLLECAQIAGLWASVDYYYDGPEPIYSVARMLVTLALCLFVAFILFRGDIDNISKALGMVVIVMVITFSISAFQIGFDTTDLFSGFVPSLPEDSATVALGMIATTCLPINVFLTSSLANGLTISETRKGIGFATIITAILSLLIIIVGTGDELEDGEEFNLNNLARTLKDSAGQTSEVLFLFGLAAASLSSGLTVAMGCALACQSLFSGLDTVGTEARQRTESESSNVEASVTTRLSQRDETNNTDDDMLIDLLPKKEPWAAGGWRFRGIIILQLLVSFCVVTSGLDTIGVIVLSQVFGGVLLPTLCFCLLICMNDEEVGTSQSNLQNALLVGATTVLTGLAVYSVAPLITGGLCQGDSLTVVSGISGFLTFVAACKVAWGKKPFTMRDDDSAHV